MALDNAFPTSATQLTTMAQWESLFSLMGSGVVPGVGSEFVPSLNSGSRLVIAGSGAASVRGFFTNGASATSTSAPTAPVTNPRIDRYVLRLDRTAVTAANWIKPVIIQGTPATNPQVPALSVSPTGSWDLPICQYRANTDGSLSGLVDERYWLSGPVVKFKSTARPTASIPRLGIEIDTRRVMWADGSAWNTLNQDVTFANLGLSPSWAHGSIGLGVALINEICYLTGTISPVPGVTFGGDIYLADLPASCKPRKTTQIPVYGDGGVSLLAIAYATGTRAGQLWLTGNVASADRALRMTTSWPT